MAKDKDVSIEQGSGDQNPPESINIDALKKLLEDKEGIIIVLRQEIGEKDLIIIDKDNLLADYKIQIDELLEEKAEFETEIADLKAGIRVNAIDILNDHPEEPTEVEDEETKRKEARKALVLAELAEMQKESDSRGQPIIEK
jgi:aspartyl-tRNA synthetase